MKAFPLFLVLLGISATRLPAQVDAVVNTGTAPGEAPRPRTPQEAAEERRACQMTPQSHAH